MRFCLLLGLLLLVPSPLPAQSSGGAAAVLRPGDLVRVDVWRQPEFSGEFIVTVDGRIGHPLLRDIRADGRSVDDVEQEIRRYLLEFIGDPVLVVDGLVRVAVGGEVARPDLYAVPFGTSLARVVAMAGGPTQWGRPDRVLLRRDGVERQFDLEQVTDGLGAAEVRSGDEVIIERRRDWLREYIAPAGSVVVSLLNLYIVIVR